MSDLPPDLSRLGDALEHAVTRAIGRRRAQLRAAWALSAVVAAVPMAFAATGVYVRAGQLPAAPAASWEPAGVEPRTGGTSVHPGPERDDRVPAGVAAGRSGRDPKAAVHPLDLVPPPVGARAARTYDAGVATERVDRRPPFALKPL